MSDDMERELERILNEDDAQDCRMDKLQQELTQLRAQVVQLSQQNLQQDLPERLASMFREGKLSSADEIKSELDRVLEQEREAMHTALVPLSETATRFTEIVSEVHEKHSKELDAIFDQAQHDDVCIRALSKMLSVASTEVVGAVKHLIEGKQGRTDTARAFQQLHAKDFPRVIGLQPIQFDAVRAAEEERASQRASTSHGATFSSQGQPPEREALNDTGSQVSILPLDLLLAASKAGFNLDEDVEEVQMDPHTTIYDASGHKMSFKGAVRLSLALEGSPKHRVVFLERKGGDATIVLGTNILQKRSLQLLLSTPKFMPMQSACTQSTPTSKSKSTQTTPVEQQKSAKSKRHPKRHRVERAPLVDKSIVTNPAPQSLERRKSNTAVIVPRMYIKPGETKPISLTEEHLQKEQILWSTCEMIPHAVCGVNQTTVTLPVTNSTKATKVFQVGETVGEWDQSLLVEKAPLACTTMLERTSAPTADRWNSLIELLKQNKSDGKLETELKTGRSRRSMSGSTSSVTPLLVWNFQHSCTIRTSWTPL
ncbi:hypothetical protein GCK32_013255 [Trichostrongylus colubriformis]|uniref:Uncharacterized protein n=1 Tax=Trichostrongylus colubriformis TaxID=6319 RepID=A0AAN8GB84_TRICO